MIRKASILLLASLFAAACATSNSDDRNQRAKRGAGIGAAAGAVAGAIIGNQTGNPRTGAAIGAVVGGAAGAAVGHRLDQQQHELQQIRGVEVTRPAQNEINVSLTNDILFDFDSAALRPESQAALGDLAGNLQRYPDEHVSVEGYTDNVGSAEYNIGLSDRRANSVRNFLVDRGLSPARVSAVGYGETRPKASNETPEGRQLNRRVEIHIIATQS